MRFTRFSSFAATAALGAATVLGGAGIAQAQSSGSLGSLMPSSSAPAEIEVSLDKADKTAAEGKLTNKTETAADCAVVVSHADVIAKVEEAAKKNSDDPFAGVKAEMEAANAKGQNRISVPAFQTFPVKADEEASWTTAGGPSDEDYQAGAAASCKIGEKTVWDFAYEPGGTGSLDNIFGSLGSSDAEADEARDADADSTGSLSSLTAGSSNDDAGDTEE